MTEPRLVSLRIGRVRTHGVRGASDPMEREWTTAYVKDPVTDAVRLTRTHLEGDEQADRRAHGGPQMAVLAYAAAHYPTWRAELALPDIGPGGFGENFTIEGLDETGVSIGDTFAIGSARVQVSQPRGPCAAISRRWKRLDLLKRVRVSGRTGWYLRVLEEGMVESGDAVRVLDRPQPEWTVARVFRARVGKVVEAAELGALATLPALSPEWRSKFERRLTE